MDLESGQGASFEFMIPKQKPPSNLTPQTFFFFLGLMNNLPFSMILGFIQKQSQSFAALNYIYLTISLVCIVAIVLNIAFLIDKKQKIKILTVVIGNTVCLVGFMTIRSSSRYNDMFTFIIQIVIIIISGIFRFAGQTIILSYIGKRNPDYIFGWNAGTGIVSLVGTGMYYLVVISKATQQTILSILIWLQIMVGILFFYVDRDKLFEINLSQITKIKNLNQIQNNQQMQKSNHFIQIVKKSWKYFLHIFLILFFSYAILLCFNSYHQNTPTLLSSIMYDIGTWISRLSLFWIRFTKWYVLNIVQVISFLIWGTLFFLVPIPLWVELIWIFFVGLVAGTVYVNLFYEVLKRKDFDSKDQETSVNFIMIGLIMGILLAVGLQVLLWNVPFPQ